MLLNNIYFSVPYWILACNYFVIMHFVVNENFNIDKDLSSAITITTVIGAVLGLTFGLVTSIRPSHGKKQKSFSVLVLRRTILNILFLELVIFAGSFYGNSMNFALNYISSLTGLITLLHLSLTSLLFHFIQQINKKFGTGVLLKYILGKYYSPKEENRVFMFVDMKSSTTIAENLEHLEYSKLIQDCYVQLTEPIMKYNAQVYQYVGDEVVLTWKITKNFSYFICLDFFYAFTQKLKNKKAYFLNTYGVQPEFKVGMHYGKVTVAEVGELKTEIAYHGDVLNSTARIQSLCNQYKEYFLASEMVIKHLGNSTHYKQKFIGELSLRGKENKMKIYSINLHKK